MRLVAGYLAGNAEAGKLKKVSRGNTTHYVIPCDTCGFKPSARTVLNHLYLLTLSSCISCDKGIGLLKQVLPRSYRAIQTGCGFISSKASCGASTPASEAKNLATVILQGEDFEFRPKVLVECSAALYIASRDLEEYKEIVKGELNEENFSDVHRQTCGILLNEKAFKKANSLIGITDIEDKRSILLEQLHRSLKEAKNPAEVLKIFKALNEALNNGGVVELIRSMIKNIDFGGIVLNPHDVYVIGSVISHIESLESADLGSCHLDEQKICNLERATAFSDLKIQRIDVSGNPTIGVRGMKSLGAFAKGRTVKELDVSSCKLEFKRLEAFYGAFGDTQISRLCASSNRQIGQGMLILGKLLENNGVLIASLCKPSDEDLTKLCEGLGTTVLSELWLDDASHRPHYATSLLDLMLRVEKRLYLHGWTITASQHRLIKDKLAELPGPPGSLTVITDDEILALGKGGMSVDTDPSTVSATRLGKLLDQGRKRKYTGKGEIPEKYIQISRLHTSGKSGITWIPICIRTEDEDVAMKVLGRKDGENWEVIKTICYHELENNCVAVETGNFKFLLAVMVDSVKAICESGKISVKGELKYDDLGNIVAKFRPDGGLDSDFDDIPGNKLITMFRNVEFEFSDRIGISINCAGAAGDCIIQSNESPNLKIGMRFLKTGCTVKGRTTEKPCPGECSIIKYTVKRNEEEIESDDCRISFSDPLRPVFAPVNLQNSVNGSVNLGQDSRVCHGGTTSVIQRSPNDLIKILQQTLQNEHQQ